MSRNIFKSEKSIQARIIKLWFQLHYHDVDRKYFITRLSIGIIVMGINNFYLFTYLHFCAKQWISDKLILHEQIHKIRPMSTGNEDH